MPASPDHEPGAHVGWIVAAITGMAGIARSLISRKPETDEEDEFADAVKRGSHRAVMLARLDELEAAQARDRHEAKAGLDRLEELIDRTRKDFRRDLHDAMDRLEQKLDDRS